jgi:hypothetical protein
MVELAHRLEGLLQLLVGGQPAMANHAIKKRAAQDLTGCREPAERLLLGSKGLITRRV